jgi:hypothetical protein
MSLLVWSLMSIMNRQSAILSFCPQRRLSSFILSPIITYFQIHSILTNKAKVKFAKINVSSLMTSKYVQVGHLVIQTNKAKTKPI